MTIVAVLVTQLTVLAGPMPQGSCTAVNALQGMDYLLAASRCTIEYTASLWGWFRNKATRSEQEEAVYRLRALGDAFGSIEADKREVIGLIRANRLSENDRNRHFDDLRRAVEKARDRLNKLLQLVRQEQRHNGMVIDTLLNDAIFMRKNWLDEYTLSDSASRDRAAKAGDLAVQALRAADLALLNLADSIDAKLNN